MRVNVRRIDLGCFDPTIESLVPTSAADHQPIVKPIVCGFVFSYFVKNKYVMHQNIH